MSMPPVALRYLVRKSASRETSVPPAELWTPENPLYGHCAVATALAEDLCGGTTKRGVIPEEWHTRLGFKSHYWNILPDGSALDLSLEQFPPDFPHDAFIRGEVGAEFSMDVRTRILANDDTRKRYEMLRQWVEILLEATPIFSDPTYQRCWELAFSKEAKCAKMRFACLVYQGGFPVVEDANRMLTDVFGKERFCSLDGTRCIRTEITARTDYALGDCAHAPIWCLQKMFELGIRPSELRAFDFYEAGFDPDGSPWFRKRPSYTCTGCQNLFAVFGVSKINAPQPGGWIELPTRESFYSSADYALGNEKVK